MIAYNPLLPLFSMHIPKCGGTSLEVILEHWFSENRQFPNLYNHPRILGACWDIRLDLFAQSVLGYGFVRHNYFHLKGHKPRVIRKNSFYSVFKLKKTPLCIHGHFDPYGSENYFFSFYPEARQFITFLRDPLEMEVSMYFYRKRLYDAGGMLFKNQRIENINMDLNQYLENKKSYLLESWPWAVNENNYIDVIENNFVFIGLLEYFEQSVKKLAEKLGKNYEVASVLNATERTQEVDPYIMEKFKSRNRLEYSIYRYIEEKYILS